MFSQLSEFKTLKEVIHNLYYLEMLIDQGL